MRAFFERWEQPIYVFGALVLMAPLFLRSHTYYAYPDLPLPDALHPPFTIGQLTNLLTLCIWGWWFGWLIRRIEMENRLPASLVVILAPYLFVLIILQNINLHLDWNSTSSFKATVRQVRSATHRNSGTIYEAEVAARDIWVVPREIMINRDLYRDLRPGDRLQVTWKPGALYAPYIVHIEKIQ